MIGVADVKENLAKEFSEKYGVDWFTDFRKLLDRKSRLCDSGGSQKTPP